LETLPLPVGSSDIFSSPTFSLPFTIVCRNLCECCIPKLFLVKAIIKEAKNTVEGERFIIITMVCSVLVAVFGARAATTSVIAITILKATAS